MTTTLTTLQKAALLSGATTFETRSLETAGLRSLTLSDGPHGIRRQKGASDHLGIADSEPATCFPTAATIACSWDTDLAERIGAALGVEADALGVDVVLGPGLNIKRSPLCGRNFEYFSEDPLLAGRFAAAYVRGIQSTGVAACPKHFAVNGQETRRMTSDSIVDERTLREIYLTGFEIAVREARPWTLMSSYNRVNGVYAHENAHLLTRILREDWGFDGVVVSDWGGANDAVAAVRAGGTLEMPAAGLDSARRIVAAVEDGELPVEDLDARVAEMARLVDRTGSARSRRPFDVDAHHALAREAAAASAVLLKNDGDLLPLAAGTRVALVGDFVRSPRYQGAGSSLVNPTRLTTPLQAMGATHVEVVAVARGFARGAETDTALADEAVRAASGADVVVAHLGLDEVAETEGRDREHLRLPAAQVSLLERLAGTGTPVVVVLSAGGVVEMPWLGSCDALVHGYLGGQAGAEGMADVLTGRATPGGRLAETYPFRLEDTPTHGNYPGRAVVAHREGPYVGYRYYTSADVPVAFAFGHGLSYTTFAYRDLLIDETGARFTLENTGDRDGVEVAQLYVGAVDDVDPLRPDRVLVGFARVALAAGQSREVEIRFDEYAFRHFDTGTDSWCVPGREWRVMVAASAQDVRLTGRHTTEGPAPVGPDGAAAYRDGRVHALDDDDLARLLGHRVPTPTGGGFDVNDPLGAMAGAASPVARLAHRVLTRLIARAESRGAPDLNLLFLYGMPPRAIAKMTNGAVSARMADSLTTMIDGHFLRGAGGLVAGYVHNARANRRTGRALASAPGGPRADAPADRAEG